MGHFGMKKGNLSLNWDPSKTRPEGQRCVLKPLFHLSFFLQLFHLSHSSSLFPPRRSLLCAHPSSSSILPPRPSFLLVPPSSSSLLPTCSSFFLVQHCLNHLESIKGHFSSIFTKALRTDGPTNGRTDGPTDGRTHAHIESLCRD